MPFMVILLHVFLLTTNILAADEEEVSKWDGKWFPQPPNAPDPNEKIPEVEDAKYPPMGVIDPECDDGKNNLTLDYDPKNVSHSIVHMCLDNYTHYRPNYNTAPVMRIYQIPTAYSAPHRCMGVNITYPENIPTFGPHRALWPQYGEYLYVPVQRWIHSLEHGAIVALYHPCAHEGLTKKLKSLVKACLFRHIITPSERLTPERPFALVAWGKSMEMSVIEDGLVREFIRDNALRGPEMTHRDGQYSEQLIEAAEIVSTKDDENLCPPSHTESNKV
uniref:Putative conserved secreted protein n=1 Tax=Lutzomyia longipalpis TaxID=7200 RepID=A0A7G3AEP2_LUTLO